MNREQRRHPQHALMPMFEKNNTHLKKKLSKSKSQKIIKRQIKYTKKVYV